MSKADEVGGQERWVRNLPWFARKNPWVKPVLELFERVRALEAAVASAKNSEPSGR